jgi:molybdopterin-guanine dinucleotide biosynthesis protein A
MGRPKATLPFGPELMLQRVVRLLGEVIGPIVVVAAPQQTLPPLPDSAIIARDQREGRGPLEGLYAGLVAIERQADAVYATSCDVPLLVPAFVRRMVELLGDHDAVVPVEDKFYHPLAAVYRTSVVAPITQLLEADRMRPAFLFDVVRTRRVPVGELRSVDPQLRTLANLNYPADYAAALADAGFTPTEA